MRKTMSMLLVGMLVSLLALSSVLAEESGITVGKGTLKIGGILQAGYTYNLEDDMGNDSFWLKRVRFLFWGTIIPDKVKYFVQLDHAGGVSALDYKAQFFYIEKTEIAVGRFLPNFTLYMPYSTAKLELINYPMTTTKFAVWRQCGLQVTTKPSEYVNFTGGIFNGGDIPNNTSDNNDAKDFLLRADIMPPVDQVKLHFGGYAWLGYALPMYTYDDGSYLGTGTGSSALVTLTFPDETLKRNRFGGFGMADYTKDEMTFRARGEFLMATTETLTGMNFDEDVCSTDQIAYFGQASVQPHKQVEVLARYEAYDPDTDTDDDGISAVTGGVNYYMDGTNAMIYLNYIHNMFQAEGQDAYGVVQAQVQITF
jgi:hypothetical protein